MKRQPSLPLVFAFLLLLVTTSCKKSGSIGDVPEDTTKKEQEQQQARADHNYSQLTGMGNVYVSAALQPGAEPQLFARAEYGDDDLAYYVSPVSGSNAGTDHRVVYGADNGSWRIMEVDGQRHTLRFYTERGGVRAPLLLHATQHSATQLEIKVFAVDWQAGSHELLASAFLRDGESIGQYKMAGTGSAVDMAAVSPAGTAGCPPPAPQATPAATVGAHLGYLHCAMAPLLEPGGGATVLLEQLRGNETAIPHYSELLADLESVSRMLDETGHAFGSFQTDPLPANGPMESFPWYAGTTDSDTAPNDMQLGVHAAASALLYDETQAELPITLVLQVADEDSIAVTGNPVFVDFRVELERDGEVQLLVEETRSSDKENGLVSFSYNAHGGAVQPKVGDKLHVGYRLSAAEGAGFRTQAVPIADSQPYAITIVSGNGQEGDWKEKLSAPLVVKVTNKAGKALKNVALEWTVQADLSYRPGVLSATQQLTDENGLAQTDYTIGDQGARPEQVRVQVLGQDRQPAGLEATFSYKIKTKNYSIVLMKPLTNQHENGDMEEWKEWKTGVSATVDYGKLYFYRIKRNGEFLKHANGEFVMSTFNVATPNGRYNPFPFQKDDMTIKNYSFIVADPVTGLTDSVVFDLTINNESYRTFIGKTVVWEGEDPYSGKKYEETFTFVNENKVKHVWKEEGSNTVENEVTSYLAIPSHVAVWSCDKKSYVMMEPKTSISVSGMVAFVTFSDGKLLTIDADVDSYQCGRSSRMLPLFK